MTDLAGALAELQAALPDVTKDKRAQVKTDKGSYSYDYADLAAISRVLLPKLAEFGLSFSAKPTIIKSGQFVLAYRLRHTSGESDGGQYPLPDPGRTQPQALGSAITYARRYALCSVTGLAPDSDDDDAQAATKRRQASASDEAKLAQLKGEIWTLAKSRGMDGAAVTQRYEQWSGYGMSTASIDDLKGFLKHLRAARTARRKTAEPQEAAATPVTEGKVIEPDGQEWPEPPADWTPGE